MRRNRKSFATWGKIGLFIYLITIAFILYFNRYGYKTYLSLKEKQRQLEKNRAKLVLKKETLIRELEMQNASSPFFIEMIARERLRMARDGEIIYFISKTKNREQK